MRLNCFSQNPISTQLTTVQKECEALKKKNEILELQIKTLAKSHVNTKCGIICGICDAILTYNELVVHVCMDQHDITCEKCKKTFISTLDFRLHFSDTKHFNIKYHQCDKCKKSFPSALLLKFHVNSSRTHPTLREVKPKLKNIDLIGNGN